MTVWLENCRTVQQGTYRLLQSELEGMPAREGQSSTVTCLERVQIGLH